MPTPRWQYEPRHYIIIQIQAGLPVSGCNFHSCTVNLAFLFSQAGVTASAAYADGNGAARGQAKYAEPGD